MNSILTQRKASLPSNAAQYCGVVSGLTWPQNRFLVGSHECAELQITLWLSGCVSVCIHHIPQPRSPMAARLSLLTSIVRHFTKKTWHQPNRQIWGSSCGASKFIYCSVGIFMVISFHCLLALLVTPKWIGKRGSRSAASTAGGWNKFRCFQNWRGRSRWWL